MFYRDTWIQINLDHIHANINTLKKHCKKEVFCVLKANAYSHGDIQVAKEAKECGCPYVAVSSLDEAMALRNKHYDGNILILGYVRTHDVLVALQNNLTLTAISYEWIKELCRLNIDVSNLKVHLKIDTGMNRIGLKKINEIKEGLSLLLSKNINVEGIYTHYHSADSEDKTSCIKQRNWFHHILDTLDHDFLWIHSSNSDATLSFSDDRSNAVRCGLAVYGITSIPTTLALKPCFSLYSRISCIKEINANETVGYGATYQSKKKEIIATIPIGYGDGFTRANQGRFVAIDGHPYEIIGRVCMDQCMIKVDKMYKVGTIVEIIGEYIDIPTMAKQLHTIPYEILCVLNDRIPKVFIKNNEYIETSNPRLFE